jgi:hypothetical protein
MQPFFKLPDIASQKTVQFRFPAACNLTPDPVFGDGCVMHRSRQGNLEERMVVRMVVRDEASSKVARKDRTRRNEETKERKQAM